MYPSNSSKTLYFVLPVNINFTISISSFSRSCSSATSSAKEQFSSTFLNGIKKTKSKGNSEKQKAQYFCCLFLEYYFSENITQISYLFIELVCQWQQLEKDFYGKKNVLFVFIDSDCFIGYSIVACTHPLFRLSPISLQNMPWSCSSPFLIQLQ